ncbi:MAG: BatA domain-containing protein, partial [Pseudomonadota bacterium]
MTLAWPAALLGLLALAVPLAIHLLQQGQHRVVMLATTRFLRNSTRQRWRRIALEQPLLFALRCALVIAATLLLAEPYRDSPAAADTARPGWLLVSPSLPAADGAAFADGAESRWLAAGFPTTASPAPESAGGGA